MKAADHQGLETRVLMLVPTAGDWDLTQPILARAGIVCVNCADQLQLVAQLMAGAGAVLIAEEAVHGGNSMLAEWLGQQPPWSDLPVLVLACAGADSPAVSQAMAEFGNVTIVERPVRAATLVSAVRSALRARQRQYQLQGERVQRERSAERLDMAMAAANAGSWQINLTTGEFSASDRAMQLHGLPPGASLNHERALACIHPDDRASIEAALQLTTLTGAAYQTEYRVPQLDGSVRWVSSQAERQGEGIHTRVIGLVQDVTERKVAEIRLKASEERFRLASVAVNGIIFEYDVQTGHVERSRGLYEVLGYQPDEALPTGAWWWEQIHPDDHDSCKRVLAKMTGDTYVNEYRVRHRDGRWLHVEERSVLLRDEAGELQKMVGCTTDITARKQAEADQQNAQRQIATTLESITDAFTRFDRDWRVVYLNDAAERMNQLPRAETMGKTVWELFPELLGTQVEAEYRRCVAEQVTVEFDYHYAPGDMWVTIRCYPTLDCGLAVYIQDITERKRAEAELRASEARFRTLFDSMDEGFCVVEMAFDEQGRAADYRVLEMNPAFEKHTGMSGLVGKSMRQAIPDLEEFWYETYGRVAATGDAIRFVRETGQMGGRWFDVFASRLGEAGSNKVAILFNDITDSRRFQEQIKASETRNSFLVTLTDTLRPLSDPITVQAEAGRVLGERLGASRVYYFEVGSDDYVIERDYTHATLSMVGRYPITSFGPNPLAALRAGCTTSEADVNALPARTPEEKATFAGLQIRSYIAVPLVKNGTFVAGLAVHADSMREWTPTEIAITEETAERTWAAVERVRAEAALRVSEERRRLALEAAELGTWHVDPLTHRTKTDERFRAIFGTTQEWMNYLQLFAVMHPDDLPAVEAAVAAATRLENPEPYAIEYRIVHPDGATRWVFAKGRATHEEGASGRRAVSFDGTVMDITDRKRAEESLRQSEARLGGILRRSPAGIVQTDAAGCMTMVNPRWCELLGYLEAELLGRNVIDITHPSFVATTAAAFDRLAAGGPDFQIEKDYCRKDGSVLRAQSNAAAIRSPSGEFLGMITVVLDISERLRSEAELRRLASELSEADRRKDVFLATLAHELRNPLAPIRNGLQLMKLAKHNDETLEKVRAMMDRQLSQLVRLVDDLLDVSRITQGKVELRKERIDLKAVIEAAVETSRTALEQAGHELVVVLPDEPIFVDGDATRLAQVVSNLLNNSAKYTHRGGHVRLSVGSEGGTAVVSVKDNGIGIPPAMLDKVFVMFTQVNRALEKTTGGLGIGLSLVKGLLEMHGGTIEAKSDGEGMGSEFVVRLPVMMDVIAESDRPNGQTSEVVPSTRRRILVVDDNVDAADSLGYLVEVLGHEVRIANDGEAGVAVARQFQPDMVLMDIGMPKLNGYEAASRIRQQPWGQAMVLVALTGWGQADDRRKSANAGFDHHLVKPIDMDDLLKLLSGES